MTTVENLQWRYAVKKFDKTKQVSAENLNYIKKAIQLTPTSYGLELYKVIQVEEKSLREKLLPASYNQKQVVDASTLFVFCRYATLEESDITACLQLKADTFGVTIDKFAGYGDFMKGALLGKPSDELAEWMDKQTYIALSNLMVACADLQIDSCPMEGFDKKSYSEILGLSEKGLVPSVVATIGYRSEEDGTQHHPKTRKSIEDLFEII